MTAAETGTVQANGLRFHYLAMGHGPLAQNLAGYQKRGSKLIHDGPCPGQHVDLAVDARIDVLSVAVLRSPDQVNVVLAQVHDAEVDADGPCDHGGRSELFLPVGLGEGGCKIKSGHFISLINHDTCRQDAVKSA